MGPVKVELLKQETKYQLMVDSEPFYIKGAGLEWGSIQSLAEHGGNAFRTWRVDNGENTGLQILDEAHKHGLMVCMGIEVARERHGFDYNDQAAVAEQHAMIQEDVLALKDHPALLMWGIGNELNLRHKNPRVWDAVNDIAIMIHEIDPNHPASTMLAGAEPEVIECVVARCPDVDLLSFQLYGEIDQLPRFLSESGYQGAYTVSEWGATGHWESTCTDWGRPLEANSTDKASDYKNRYLECIVADTKQCIGSFVFLWGQKQERTPTWYGVILENGMSTESAQVMQYLWTGEWPTYRVPSMSGLTINGLRAQDSVQLIERDICQADVITENPSGQALRYRWEIMAEVDKSVESDGGDFEPSPEIIWSDASDTSSTKVEFAAPSAGEYRLFVYVEDTHGNAATANMPILVEPMSFMDSVLHRIKKYF